MELINSRILLLLISISSLLLSSASAQSSTPDPIASLQIEISSCLKHTEEALTQFKTASDMSPAVKVCQEVYESAVDDLKSLTEAIAAHNVATIQTKLAGVITNFDTCDDTVAESPDFKLPLKDEAVVTLRKAASNCLAISKLLH